MRTDSISESSTAKTVKMTAARLQVRTFVLALVLALALTFPGTSELFPISSGDHPDPVVFHAENKEQPKNERLSDVDMLCCGDVVALFPGGR